MTLPSLSALTYVGALLFLSLRDTEDNEMSACVTEAKAKDGSRLRIKMAGGGLGEEIWGRLTK